MINQYRLIFGSSEMDAYAIHYFLSQSYWSPGIPLEIVQRAIHHSLCFGIRWHENADSSQQVAFARVITDQATFAYLADVYVLEAHRGQGLARRMMEAIEAHPALQGLRRHMLVTRDAHDLYARFGYRPVGNPDRIMEILRPDVYRSRT